MKYLIMRNQIGKIIILNLLTQEVEKFIYFQILLKTISTHLIISLVLSLMLFVLQIHSSTRLIFMNPVWGLWIPGFFWLSKPIISFANCSLGLVGDFGISGGTWYTFFCCLLWMIVFIGNEIYFYFCYIYYVYTFY